MRKGTLGIVKEENVNLSEGMKDNRDQVLNLSLFFFIDKSKKREKKSFFFIIYSTTCQDNENKLDDNGQTEKYSLSYS